MSHQWLLALLVLFAVMVSLLVSGPAFAQTPEDPNCLGQDLSAATQVIQPFGLFVRMQVPINDNALSHLQGKVPGSSCPLDGFPTPWPPLP